MQKPTGREGKGTAKGPAAPGSKQTFGVEDMLTPYILQIKRDLSCVTHADQICYVRTDELHVQYTNANLADHARLLVSSKCCAQFFS